MSDKNYFYLIFSHIGIGLLIFLFPIISKLYAILIIATGLYFTIKNKNKNYEALYAAAYIVGVEVFLRITYGNYVHEYGKYFVFLFMILSIYFSGLPRLKNPYWIYLLLLIPSIVLAIENLKDNVRTTILFNVFGPICLGVCSLYMFKRKISINHLNAILLTIALPIVAMISYLFLKCPKTDFPIYSTESNYILSGGYAPNQVASILGLGMFIMIYRIFLVQSSRLQIILDLFIFIYTYYRTLLTFSRGGAITGIVVIFILFLLLILLQYKNRFLYFKIASFIFLIVSVFCLTSQQTDSLLWKRYADQNPSGLQKGEEQLGRKEVAIEEVQIFKKKPLLGVGVGKATEIRKYENDGRVVTSHNETTRLLAEHGILGMISIIILLVTPIFLFIRDKRNFYLVCFFVFWFLTINHSAMRIVAPAFIYALALLRIDEERKSFI